jgi:hypothetical protein
MEMKSLILLIFRNNMQSNLALCSHVFNAIGTGKEELR